MSITYNEILDSMKAAFQQEKGEAVADLSDLELRFKAVASEIYSVCAYGDYIFRQGFPQNTLQNSTLNGLRYKACTAQKYNKEKGGTCRRRIDLFTFGSGK